MDVLCLYPNLKNQTHLEGSLMGQVGLDGLPISFRPCLPSELTFTTFLPLHSAKHFYPQLPVRVWRSGPDSARDQQVPGSSLLDWISWES